MEKVETNGVSGAAMNFLTEPIILQLLNWPVLLFFGCILFLVIYRKSLGGVFARGGITLVWGDKSFSISELPDQLNESFSVTNDDIESLSQRVEELEQRLLDTPDVGARNAEVSLSDEAACDRMLGALEEGEYRWRSIERLALIGGTSTERAVNILQPLTTVIFGKGKSGRTIVRLLSR